LEKNINKIESELISKISKEVLQNALKEKQQTENHKAYFLSRITIPKIRQTSMDICNKDKIQILTRQQVINNSKSKGKDYASHLKEEM